MRSITFLITFTVVFCGATIAGPTSSLPNAGLFFLDSAPTAVDAPTIVASRQLNNAMSD